jgi:hypothetical protein
MDLFRIVMFEQQKAAKLKSVLKGALLGLFSGNLRKQTNDTTHNSASSEAGNNKLSSD